MLTGIHPPHPAPGVLSKSEGFFNYPLRSDGPGKRPTTHGSHRHSHMCHRKLHVTIVQHQHEYGRDLLYRDLVFHHQGLHEPLSRKLKDECPLCLMPAHLPCGICASNYHSCLTNLSHHQNIESPHDGDLLTPGVPAPSSTFSQSPPLSPGRPEHTLGFLNSKLVYSL